MKHFTLLIALYFCALFTFSQSSPSNKDHIVDSLFAITLSPEAHDTSKANAYLELSEILVAENIDTVKFLCEKSKAIAEKNLRNNNLSRKEDTIYKVILSKSLGQIGYYYGEIGDVEKQKQLYLKSLEIIKKVGSEIDIAATLNNVGYVFGILGDIEKQKQYYIESLQKRKAIGDKDGTALSLYNLGILYFNQGDIPLALDYLYKALKIQEDIDKKEDIASSLNSIGYIYGQQGNIEKQKEFYLKGLAISQQINDKHGMVLAYNNLGAIYKTQGENEKALTYFYDCLKLSKEIKLLRGISTSLNNIGHIYEAQNDFDAALKNYHESLIVREDINDKGGIINSLLSIGGIFYKQDRFKEANLYAKKALKIAKEIGFPDEIKMSANLLQKASKDMGNYKEGWEAYELYISMRDSINNIETQKAAIEQNMQYEFDKKEAIAAVEHAKEISLKEAEKKKQVIIIWAISIGLVLILVFTFLIVKRLRIINAQKLLIEEKNKNITDSITYALRIQQALLTTDEHLHSQLKEHFIFFKPRDIVSGDFYWNFSADDIVYIACCDCTGHGVPGAFMSLLNITLLNETVVERKVIRPDLVLNDVRENIIKALNPKGSDIESNDGMDAVFCKLDLKNNILQAACANNPIWIITSAKDAIDVTEKTILKSPEGDKYLYEIKADKMPVGPHHSTATPFTLREVKLQKGDCVYMITDGYVDQFGGAKGKKFKHKQLKELLLANAHKSMDDQKKVLHEVYKKWKGDEEQVDDICIIGIKV